MKAVFIGNETQIALYSKLFAQSGNEYFKLCGVISTSPEATTKLAISLNIKAYLSLEDAVKDGDVLFICRNGNHLASFSDLMKKMHVRDKIICHFSPHHDSTIINCGSTNSYYSIGVPYLHMSQEKISNTVVTFEGGGKHREKFENAMKSVLPNAVFCDKNSKQLGSIATRIVTEYTKILVNISMHFFKMSGMYDEESFLRLVTGSVTDTLTSKTMKKARKRTEGELRRDIRLLSTIDYSDTKEFYKTMETRIADSGIYSPDEKETVLRILKKRA